MGNLVTLHLALEKNPTVPSDCVISLLDVLRVEAGLRILSCWGVPDTYVDLIRTQQTNAPARSHVQRGALIIHYASDISRVLGLGLPPTEPVDLVEHPIRASLKLPEDIVGLMKEELAVRVQELGLFMIH